MVVNKEDVQVIKLIVKALSPKNDQHQFSSNNIKTQSRVNKKIMKITW